MRRLEAWQPRLECAGDGAGVSRPEGERRGGGEGDGARGAALLAVLYAAGLRRSEAVALDLGDYDHESGVLTVRSGTGRKARTGHATNGAKAALDAWLVKRGWRLGRSSFPSTAAVLSRAFA